MSLNSILLNNLLKYYPHHSTMFSTTTHRLLVLKVRYYFIYFSFVIKIKE